MYGYIPDARGKTDGYQQVYTLPDFRLLFQVSGYGYAVGYIALLRGAYGGPTEGLRRAYGGPTEGLQRAYV